jgi:hypothetical protein
LSDFFHQTQSSNDIINSLWTSVLLVHTLTTVVIVFFSKNKRMYFLKWKGDILERKQRTLTVICSTSRSEKRIGTD